MSAYIKSMYQMEEGGCKSWVLEAPKRQAVGSPKAGDLNTHNPDYAPIALSESEADDEMHEPWDDLQLSPGSPTSISDDDWDKERDPLLGPCTTHLERISLGADGDACACIEAKKKALAKRNVKCARRTKKEHVPGWTYRWVEKYFHKREVLDLRARLKKHPKPIAIWAICKLCLYKNLKAKAYGEKTKITHCPLWDWMCETCGEHALFAHPKGNWWSLSLIQKAHWDNLEDKKARKSGVETRHEGQSTLDDCVQGILALECWKETLRVEPRMIVPCGESTFACRHPARFS